MINTNNSDPLKALHKEQDYQKAQDKSANDVANGAGKKLMPGNQFVDVEQEEMSGDTPTEDTAVENTVDTSEKNMPENERLTEND